MTGFESQLSELFREANALKGAEQESYMEGLRRARPEVAAELEELLAFDARESPLSRGPGEWEGHSSVGASAERVKHLSELSPPPARYKLQGEIGRGGMGAILRVWDEALRRPLAMKVVLGQEDAARKGPTPPVDDRVLGRFLEEAQVTGQLDHPGVVPVHELAVNEDGAVYFTMRLVRGVSLGDVFAFAREENEGWNQTRALSVLLKVCETMSYAHSKGVIHRDLKPANIMVGRYGEVYVMDWGLAKVQGRADDHDLRPMPQTALLRAEHLDPRAATDSPLTTMDGTVLGTAAYMSLEQGRGRLEELGPRSDVYAVGAMLYELLAGWAPYVSSADPVSPYVLLASLLKEPPRPVQEWNPRVPPELQAICEKAMARRIEDRYADMDALGSDLRAYLEHRVVQAHQTGALVELRKWVERNRVAALSLCGAVLALILGLTATLFFQARSEVSAAEAREKGEDVLRLSAFQRLEDLSREADSLLPAGPSVLDHLTGWVERARAVLAGLDENPETGSLGHRAQLERLRARAIPASAEELEVDRRSHPRFPELTPLQARIEALERADALRHGRTETAPSELEDEPANAQVANDSAWPLVDPERFVFGQEGMGLALAQRALELASSPEDRATCSDTLAWAFLANGLDEDALAMGELSLEEAPPVIRARNEGSLKRLREAVDAAKSGRALQDARADFEALSEEVSRRRTWRWAESSDEETWWHNQLVKLIAALGDFRDHGLMAEDSATPEHGWSVPRRIAFVRRLSEEPERGRIAAAWAAAVPVIRAAYAGLEFEPPFGLLPIGIDPESQLLEFAHLATGTPPERDDEGHLVLSEETGLVFVLLPGGTFRMGAQRTDRGGWNYDPDALPNESPVHEVTLSPFFLSKYEMTQSQWLRVKGENPSELVPGRYVPAMSRLPQGSELLHPVESVPWGEALQALDWQGLTLPTEAQWEYAARAGTSSPWWPGSQPAELAKVANLTDQWYRRNGGPPGGKYEDWDDGNSVHAAVGAYPANPFGLHDLQGNVWEWCFDVFDPAFYGGSTAQDPRSDLVGSLGNLRTYRGGSFNSPGPTARSAFRSFASKDIVGPFLGLRPALLIEPATRPDSGR